MLRLPELKVSVCNWHQTSRNSYTGTPSWRPFQEWCSTVFFRPPFDGISTYNLFNLIFKCGEAAPHVVLSHLMLTNHEAKHGTVTLLGRKAYLEEELELNDFVIWCRWQIAFGITGFFTVIWLCVICVIHTVDAVVDVVWKLFSKMHEIWVSFSDHRFINWQNTHHLFSCVHVWSFSWLCVL